MTPKKLKVGVVGATGMVGQTFMSLLEERKFPIAELRPFASESSAIMPNSSIKWILKQPGADFKRLSEV